MESSVRKITAQIRKDAWTQNISDRNASGLSIKEWCSRKGINETSYYYWLKKIRLEIIDASKQGEEEKHIFVPMLHKDNSPPQKSQIETICGPEMTITIGNMTIEFNSLSSQDLILNVLKALKDV